MSARLLLHVDFHYFVNCCSFKLLKILPQFFSSYMVQNCTLSCVHYIARPDGCPGWKAFHSADSCFTINCRVLRFKPPVRCCDSESYQKAVTTACSLSAPRVINSLYLSLSLMVLLKESMNKSWQSPFLPHPSTVTGPSSRVCIGDQWRCGLHLPESEYFSPGVKSALVH